MTYVPIAVEPVLTDELSRAQIDWLNAYHKLVYDTLAPRLTEAECAWLAQKDRAHRAVRGLLGCAMSAAG